MSESKDTETETDPLGLTDDERDRARAFGIPPLLMVAVQRPLPPVPDRPTFYYRLRDNSGWASEGSFTSARFDTPENPTFVTLCGVRDFEPGSIEILQLDVRIADLLLVGMNAPPSFKRVNLTPDQLDKVTGNWQQIVGGSIGGGGGDPG